MSDVGFRRWTTEIRNRRPPQYFTLFNAQTLDYQTDNQAFVRFYTPQQQFPLWDFMGTRIKRIQQIQTDFLLKYPSFLKKEIRENPFNLSNLCSHFAKAEIADPLSIFNNKSLNNKTLQ
jgi:hypothetical protein